jgi:hypothetical protein
MTTIDDVVVSSNPSRSETDVMSHFTSGLSMLNARAVEFIAKPGRVRELRNCLRKHIVGFLKRRSGFAGAFILASHKEPRLVLVLSFWNTEREAVDNSWEDAPAVRSRVSSLVDVCTKVHTYEAALADSSALPTEETGVAIC